MDLRHLAERARYRVDNLFARGTFMQFVLLLGLTAMAVLVGMSAALLGLFGEANERVEAIPRGIDQGLWDSFWWSIGHIFDPSFVTANYGATLPVLAISFGLSMVGMLVFGTLIGFVSSGIEGRLEALRRGNSAVMESGHTLILGWNDKIFSILRLLESMDRPVTVVILSQLSIGDMQERVRTGVGSGAGRRRVRLVYRTGSPTSLVELERVAFARAFNIVVLSDESASAELEDPDIRVIKTLVLLASYRGWGDSRPKIAAEILQRGYYEAAEIAAREQVTLVNSSEVVSRIIVQAARQPAISRVYKELLGFSGSELYVRGFPECEGRAFGTLFPSFPGAVPVGVSRRVGEPGRQRYLPVLNPGHDYVVGAGEWLIFLSEGEGIRFDPEAPAASGPEPPATAFQLPPPNHVLVLGWNESVYDVLRELDRQLDPGSTVTVVAGHPPERAAELLAENHGEVSGRIRLDYRQANYARRETLRAFVKDRCDSVIVLADRSAGDSDPDSRTLITLLTLRDVEQELGLPPDRPVVSEFLSTHNAEILSDERVSDVVVSPEIVSMLLTQVSQQLILKAVYEELLVGERTSVFLKPVGLYVAELERATFADLLWGASRLGETALGVRLAREADSAADNFGLHLNPDRHARLGLSPDDRVVVIAPAC